MRNPAPGSRSGKRSCRGASPEHINKSSGLPLSLSSCEPLLTKSNVTGGRDSHDGYSEHYRSTVARSAEYVGIRTHFTQHGDR